MTSIRLLTVLLGTAILAIGCAEERPAVSDDSSDEESAVVTPPDAPKSD